MIVPFPHSICLFQRTLLKRGLYWIVPSDWAEWKLIQNYLQKGRDKMKIKSRGIEDLKIKAEKKMNTRWS